MIVVILLVASGLVAHGFQPLAGQGVGRVPLAVVHDVDTVAAYRAVLYEISAEQPSVPLVLSQSRSDVECMPHCGETGNRERHPDAMLLHLASEGVIQETCWIPDNTLGCDTPRPGHLLVAVGPMRGPSAAVGAPEHDATVTVVAYKPCPTACRFPDASAYKYLLKQDAEGSWRVVKLLPVWIA